MNCGQVAGKIEDFIKCYVAGIAAKGVVIGISGGLDSAVVVMLALRALGQDKVFGVLLPYVDMDGAHDADVWAEAKNIIKDARTFLDCFPMSFQVVDIRPMVSAIASVVLPSDGFMSKGSDAYNKLMGNLKARVRMCILYGIANRDSRLVLGTTNKSELAIGYFTKFGDGACDIEPIADLYKTEVFELAKYLKVPEQIIKKKPSADLWAGQTDEGEIGMTYKKLDKILKRMEHEYVKAWDLNNGLLGGEKVRDIVVSSEHKRNIPPVCEIDAKLKEEK